MREILRMIFHLADPDHEGKGDSRFIFRRKKERLFLKNFLGAQVIVYIIFLLGVGVALKNLRHEYDHLHKKAVLARADVAETNKHLVIAYEEIDELSAKQKQGHRFTAANAWQMSQLILNGKVDMLYFPAYDLVYPDGTWYHGWLNAHGFLVEDDG